MTRLVDEFVAVRRRDDEPAEFLWRGRLYLVRAVLGRWAEAGEWWVAPAARALYRGEHPPATTTGIDDREREVWRVEAAAGRSAGTGVYELRYDPSTGTWSLARVLD